jgi:hypothetical protein
MPDGPRDGRLRVDLEVKLQFKTQDRPTDPLHQQVLERMLVDRLAILGHGREPPPISSVEWSEDGRTHTAMVPLTLITEQQAYLAAMRVAFAHMTDPLVDITAPQFDA